MVIERIRPSRWKSEQPNIARKRQCPICHAERFQIARMRAAIRHFPSPAAHTHAHRHARAPSTTKLFRLLPPPPFLRQLGVHTHRPTLYGYIELSVTRSVPCHCMHSESFDRNASHDIDSHRTRVPPFAPSILCVRSLTIALQHTHTKIAVIGLRFPYLLLGFVERRNKNRVVAHTATQNVCDADDCEPAATEVKND